MDDRVERDSLGAVHIPKTAYYGPQTARAAANFIDSGLKMPGGLLRALAMIKCQAAAANEALALLDGKRAAAIQSAAREVMQGAFDDQFVVDVFQTGSGTSTNMNMNEVLAARANERLTGKRGGKAPVHPNDHVNLGQSGNDVIPSAIHVAALIAVKACLVPGLRRLENSLKRQAERLAGIRKIGRTHLQDAVPIFLGQEFGGYARQTTLSTQRVESAAEDLKELALGGTAVGNGLNTHPHFAGRVISGIAGETGIDFREAHNHFEAQGARDAAVAFSGALKTVSVSLGKIANDIRWLSSGPRCGLGELLLEPLQPGSSIMPGKVNPIVPEAMLQIAAQVIGNDAAITIAGQGGSFELNTMLPLIAYNLLQSITILGDGADFMAEKCIDGLTANATNCAACVDKSLALATYLVPELGYDQAAEIAGKAHAAGKTIRQILEAEALLPPHKIARYFNTDLKADP